MAGGGLFGARPVGAVTVVETPVSQSYARKARIAFLAVAAAVWVSVTAVLAVFTALWLAMLVGILAGFLCGLVVAVVVRVWPVLRVLWWWSTEITVAVLVVLGPAWVVLATMPWHALVMVVGTAGVDAEVGGDGVV